MASRCSAEGGKRVIGAAERGVEIEGSCGGSEDEDARCGEEAVDSGEELCDDLDVGLGGVGATDAEAVDVFEEKDGEGGGVGGDDGGGAGEEV